MNKRFVQFLPVLETMHAIVPNVYRYRAFTVMIKLKILIKSREPRSNPDNTDIINAVSSYNSLDTKLTIR